MVAGKVAAVIVGTIAIAVSLLAKGQNAAQLVGLAYAVAASANLPALIGTLYWKRCNILGVICGVVGGAIVAITLVLVSPNMQYPMLIKADATVAMEAATKQLQALNARLGDPTINQKDADALTARVSSVRADFLANQAKYDAVKDQSTSLVGLEKPLINLKNPGIISVPLGVLFLIVGSLLYRRRNDASVEAKWKALVFRRDSGIGVEEATAH
jgi:cation/acetate symporter